MTYKGKEVIRMYFPSKKDIWFFFLFWGTILVTIFISLFILEPDGVFDRVVGQGFMILMTIPLILIWFRTGYTISDSNIVVYFGPFRKTINMDDIKKICKVKHPFTAPALSIDRMEIMYKKFDVITISPKKEREFIDQILKRNPHIQVDENIFSNE